MLHLEEFKASLYGDDSGSYSLQIHNGSTKHTIESIESKQEDEYTHIKWNSDVKLTVGDDQDLKFVFLNSSGA